MRVRIFEAEPWECPGFESLHADHDVQCVEGPLTEENAAGFEDVEAISTFLYSKLNGAVLAKLPNLKLIATRSTGYDHIDLDCCRAHGIVVSNVPDYGRNTVAEHVFGLLLTLSHRLFESIDRTRRGDFSLKGLQGFDLYGKTLGVLGTGEIGLCVVRIAHGFGMKVLAFDLQPNEAAAAEMGFDYVDMDTLLSSSDVITLHVPGNEKTRHLISEREFGLMKKGTVLINTARGRVVDVRALVRALAEGQIAGAGLDVLPEEPIVREEAELLRSVYQRTHDLETLLADSIILRLRNVVVTPHSAFNTREAVGRIIEVTAGNILAFAKGAPMNVVA